MPELRKLLKTVLAPVNAILGVASLRLIRIHPSIDDPWHKLSDLKGIDVVVDIGVGEMGSPFLYRHFPESRFISIDPLVECEHVVRAALSRSGQDNLFISTACGRETGSRSLHVANKLSRSTFHMRAEMPDESFESYADRLVTIQRLDDIIPPLNLTGSMLLKIDAEGAELDILQGAEGVIGLFKYVLLEAPTVPEYTDSYDIVSLICWMRDHGFGGFAVFKADAKHADLCFYRS